MKYSIYVKSAIAQKEQVIVPLKTDASLSCISLLPLVLIAVLPNKYALKLASGIFTYCQNPMIGKKSNISNNFLLFLTYLFSNNFIISSQTYKIYTCFKIRQIQLNYICTKV